jgi:hypothetical protein
LRPRLWRPVSCGNTVLYLVSSSFSGFFGIRGERPPAFLEHKVQRDDAGCRKAPLARAGQGYDAGAAARFRGTMDDIKPAEPAQSRGQPRLRRRGSYIPAGIAEPLEQPRGADQSNPRTSRVRISAPRVRFRSFPLPQKVCNPVSHDLNAGWEAIQSITISVVDKATSEF